MPYIKKENRKIFNDYISQLHPKDAGDLNYIITTIADEYIAEKGKRYQNLNEVIGVFESAKLEFYRRLVAPYEDIKINENGDVYNNL